MTGRSAFRAAMAAKTAADKRRVYWQTRAWLLTERGREAVKGPPDTEDAPTSVRQKTDPCREEEQHPANRQPHRQK